MNGLRVSHSLVTYLLFLALLVLPSATGAQQTQEQLVRDILALKWQQGPADGSLGDKAIIKIPEAYMFLDGPNTRKFLELNQNPPRDNHYTVAPEDLAWFAVFSFNQSGYVRDDEKLDSDALLKVLKENDGPSNEERRRLGMPTLYTEGWHVAPHYDLQSKRLEWGVKLRQEDGSITINYTTRLLGRTGVMHATLVSDTESLDRNIRAFKATLAGYIFVPGERYSEFKSGDRVAQYGLSALIVGGAAAAVAKTGAGKAVAKFLVLGAAALGAALLGFLRKLFRWRS